MGSDEPPFLQTLAAGMGQGEVAEADVAPDLAYGPRGDRSLGVPPGASVRVTVEMERFVRVEDISPAGDGSAVKRVLTRGRGAESPRKGDRVSVRYALRAARSCEAAPGVAGGREVEGEVLHEREAFHWTLGEMGARPAEAMRLFCDGADAPSLLTLLASQMVRGEVAELTCAPSFCGGVQRLVATVELLGFAKVVPCPGTGGGVTATLLRDEVKPSEDERGPNRESVCRVRYAVRLAGQRGGEPLDTSGDTPVEFVQGKASAV